MNPIILPPAMGKIVGQTRFFSLDEATNQGEGKSLKKKRIPDIGIMVRVFANGPSHIKGFKNGT